MDVIIPGGARFANQFFVNMVYHFFAIKYGFKVNYYREHDFNTLGIRFYKGDKQVDKNVDSVHLTDKNFYEYLVGNTIPDFHFTFNGYGQTKQFATHIKDYFNTEAVKNNIIESNRFKDRYTNNNDVCIHVRLGDVPEFNPGFEYYDKVLSTLNYNKGYICSDSLEHSICIELIKKYGLIKVIGGEIDTLSFASTAKNLILSTGTFSWLIGVLGFHSNVYYPKIKKVWHGDVFVFPEWNEIT